MSRELLDELAEVAREEQEPPTGDARLDALMRGELDADQERQLRAEKGVSEEGRAAYEASRPFDGTARERFLARATSELKATASPSSAVETATQGADAEARVAPVVPIRSKPIAKFFATGGLLLAAAALVLLLLRPAAQPGLPAYDFRMAGGEQSLRASSAEDPTGPVLGPGSAVQLLLRPTVPAKASVAARAFVVEEGSWANGRVANLRGVHALDLVAEISQEGAVRIDVPGEAVTRHVSAETAWLVVVVAPSESVPNTAAQLAAEDGAVQRFARRVRVRTP
jgi:hypothetical protein